MLKYPNANPMIFRNSKKEHRPEHVFKEKARIEKLSLIRELVFGAQDGLLVPLGVVSSVAGAFSNNHIVIVAGIAEALAGAFSMGTGAFLASQAERQVHVSEIEKERKAIERNPKEEHEELVLMFEKEGLSRANAEIAVEKISTSPAAFFNTMVQKELGLDPEPPGTPLKDAMYVGLSYFFAAFIPILPYFFTSGPRAIAWSITMTLAALFFIGVLKARGAMLPLLKSGLQVLAIGGLSGIGGYALGTFLPYLLGIR